MKISELVKELRNIKSKYGDIEVTISLHEDANSCDFQNEIDFVLFEDYQNKKTARIFYSED